MEEPSFYAVIPANVRYDKSLPPNAKLLYGEITALCSKHGYCWAENSYFAELYSVENETISRWISKLKKLGYIRTEIVYKEGTKEIAQRRIYLLTFESIPIDKKINTPRQKNQYPIDEKVKDITTGNNTTNKYTEDCAKQSRNSDIPLTEKTLSEQPDSAYLDAAISTLQEKRMDSPFSMPEWYQTIAYTETLNSDSILFGKCIEWIGQWARGRITPRMVADNFGKFLTELDKPANGEKSNGQYKSTLEKRGELAINSYNTIQAIRKRVEARRNGGI